MMKASYTVRIDPESELARVLADSDGCIVLLDSNGRRYRVIPADEDSAVDDYKPDADNVRRVLAETVGSWADLDIDQLVADVAEARRKGSRPLDHG